jgi:hypothetical protein
MAAFTKTIPEIIAHLISFVGCFLIVILYRKLNHIEMDKKDLEKLVIGFGLAAIIFVTGDMLHFLYRLLFQS